MADFDFTELLPIDHSHPGTPWRHVTSEGVTARQFCDRCVKCGTSPKGRVADLTVAAFVELGGNLEDGCFNATLTTITG